MKNIQFSGLFTFPPMKLKEVSNKPGAYTMGSDYANITISYPEEACGGNLSFQGKQSGCNLYPVESRSSSNTDNGITTQYIEFTTRPAIDWADKDPLTQTIRADINKNKPFTNEEKQQFVDAADLKYHQLIKKLGFKEGTDYTYEATSSNTKGFNLKA